jgi:hypothetical protein
MAAVRKIFTSVEVHNLPRLRGRRSRPRRPGAPRPQAGGESGEDDSRRLELSDPGEEKDAGQSDDHRQTRNDGCATENRSHRADRSGNYEETECERCDRMTHQAPRSATEVPLSLCSVTTVTSHAMSRRRLQSTEGSQQLPATNGTPLALMVNLVLLGMAAVGLPLSLWRTEARPNENAGPRAA